MSGRADATLAVIVETIEDFREVIDHATGLRTILLLIHYDRRTGQPESTRFRPDIERAARAKAGSGRLEAPGGVSAGKSVH